MVTCIYHSIALAEMTLADTVIESLNVRQCNYKCWSHSREHRQKEMSTGLLDLEWNLWQRV